MSDPLFQFQNPFTQNPNFSASESNFIEKGISNGIEKGFGKLGDKVISAGQIKTENFAHNLPELASLALISYLIYLGYMSFIKNGKTVEVEALFAKIYPVFMVYIIFKLFWKVVLKI